MCHRACHTCAYSTPSRAWRTELSWALPLIDIHSLRNTGRGGTWLVAGDTLMVLALRACWGRWEAGALPPLPLGLLEPVTASILWCWVGQPAEPCTLHDWSAGDLGPVSQQRKPRAGQASHLFSRQLGSQGSQWARVCLGPSHLARVGLNNQAQPESWVRSVSPGGSLYTARSLTQPRGRSALHGLHRPVTVVWSWLPKSSSCRENGNAEFIFLFHHFHNNHIPPVSKHPGFVVGSWILTHSFHFPFFFNNTNSPGGRWVPPAKRAWGIPVEKESQKGKIREQMLKLAANLAI